MFQQSYVDPAKQILERQIVPSLKEAYLGEETGSSALNQALSQSATDLSTALGSQMMNQYNLGQNRQLSALGQLGQLAGHQTMPIQQQQGILGPLIGALGTIGGGIAGGPMGASLGTMLSNLLLGKQETGGQNGSIT